MVKLYRNMGKRKEMIYLLQCELLGGMMLCCCSLCIICIALDGLVQGDVSTFLWSIEWFISIHMWNSGTHFSSFIYWCGICCMEVLTMIDHFNMYIIHALTKLLLYQQNVLSGRDMPIWFIFLKIIGNCIERLKLI